MKRSNKIKLLTICVTLACTLTTYNCVNAQSNLKENLIETVYVNELGNVTENQVYGVVIPEGTCKVDNVLSDSSGISSVGSKRGIGNLIKTSVIKVLGTVTVISTVENLLDLMEAYVGSFNYSKEISIETRESYRYFYHYVKRYQNNAWTLIGVSTNKYWYKHIYVTGYNSTTGDYFTCTKDFTHGQGFDPEYIQKSANYMDYETLIKYSEQSMLGGVIYRESY